VALPREIGVVGLGLMGASLARALRAADPSIRLVAAEPQAEVRAAALRDGVVDAAAAAPDPVLARCEVAVLCTPVAGIEALLAPVSALLPAGAILTDVGGAKERVVALARERVRAGVRFVGSHPMFGGHGGYAGASADKWRGGTVAVCTDADPAAVDAIASLHEALGATVSHLPYLVASALAAAARDAGPLAARLAGPGLRDTTRLAAFPFDIQGEVARRNDHLPEAAERLRGHLDRILAAIASSPEAARAALEEARAAREGLF